jgi:hypothetical protein
VHGATVTTWLGRVGHAIVETWATAKVFGQHRKMMFEDPIPTRPDARR